MDKRRPQDFPASTLQKWKADRERGNEAALSQLTNVTAETLQNTFTGVLKERDDRLHEAISRLEQSDAEAARLLRDLLDEVAALRSSSYLDSGVTEDFARAADRLYQLYSEGALEDFAIAAHRLPDY